MHSLLCDRTYPQTVKPNILGERYSKRGLVAKLKHSQGFVYVNSNKVISSHEGERSYQLLLYNI